jgi:hypothetical protein
VSDERDVVARMVRRMDAIEGQMSRLERERLRAIDGRIAGNTRAIELLVAAQGSGDGQPDWLACRDPQVAEEWLLQVAAWTADYAEPLKADLPGCWPWHPAAVAILLAASRHHAAVMAGDAESLVTDYLVRILPSVGARVRAVASTCHEEKHYVGNAGFAYDTDRLVDLARWWATDRLGLALGLTSWEERLTRVG